MVLFDRSILWSSRPFRLYDYHFYGIFDLKLTGFIYPTEPTTVDFVQILWLWSSWKTYPRLGNTGIFRGSVLFVKNPRKHPPETTHKWPLNCVRSKVPHGELCHESQSSNGPTNGLSRRRGSVCWGVHLPSHHQNFVTFLVGDIDGYIAITWKGTTQSIIQYLKDVAEKEV